MRFCNRCREPLLTKAGDPDYRAHFHPDCRKADTREKRAWKKRNLKTSKKCPWCGRAKSKDAGVSRDTPTGEGFQFAMVMTAKDGSIVSR